MGYITAFNEMVMKDLTNNVKIPNLFYLFAKLQRNPCRKNTNF